MATLTTEDKAKIWAGIMRLTDFGWAGIKSDLLEAVNATDDWIDNNQGSFNSALPSAFRDNATLAQKTILFCVVAAMRVGVDFAKRLVSL